MSNLIKLTGSVFLLSFLFSSQVRAGGVFGTTEKTKNEISSCVESKIKKINTNNYLKKEKKEENSIEYTIRFNDKDGDYRIIIKDWKNSRTLSLFYPKKTERKDRFLNQLVIDCTD